MLYFNSYDCNSLHWWCFDSKFFSLKIHWETKILLVLKYLILMMSWNENYNIKKCYYLAIALFTLFWFELIMIHIHSFIQMILEFEIWFFIWNELKWIMNIIILMRSMIQFIWFDLIWFDFVVQNSIEMSWSIIIINE